MEINKEVLAVLAFSVALPMVMFVGSEINAQAVDPVLERDPISTNASEQVQMTIRPDDTIPPNGTQTMSMEGMNDVDFKGSVPAGVTVIVTNTTAVVTNGEVALPPGSAGASEASAEEEPEPTPAEEEE